jgi:hypothetical protein
MMVELLEAKALTLGLVEIHADFCGEGMQPPKVTEALGSGSKARSQVRIPRSLE